MRTKVLTLTLLLALLAAVPAAAAGEFADARALRDSWESGGYPDDVGAVVEVGKSGWAVLLTADTPERESGIGSMLKNPAAVAFGTSKYSHNELVKACGEIESRFVGQGQGAESCRVGWRSDGKGFGDTGLEERVVVKSTAGAEAELTDQLETLYGDMAAVEMGTNRTASAPSLFSSSGTLYEAAVVAVLLAAYWVVWKRQRRTPDQRGRDDDDRY